MPVDPMSYFDEHAENYAFWQNEGLANGVQLAELIGAQQLNRGVVALDLGCGPGILSAELAPQVGHVVATDLAPGMIGLAVRQAASVGASNVSFAVADANQLPFGADSFDLIVSRSVLQFTDLQAVLPRLRSMLRIGGLFAVTQMTTEPPGTLSRMRALLDRLRFALKRSAYVAREQGRHVGLRLLGAHLHHMCFSLRFDAVRLDREAALAIYRHELPGCDIRFQGRYLRVRWAKQESSLA